MSKIKLLVIGFDYHGVGYYRCNSPYLSINDPDIEIKYLPISDMTFRFDENHLKDINAIIYQKALPIRKDDELKEFLAARQKYNIKIIYDIDDYWELDSSHPQYKLNNVGNRIQAIIDNIRFADYVSTTTTYLADKIKEYNKNVVIFENAININEQQWIPNKNTSDKTRFLWGGGITHKQDLSLMKNAFDFDKHDKLLDEIQVYMCGYDLRTSNMNGEMSIASPQGCIWTEFEKIFTNNYKSIKNNAYASWLLKYIDNGEDQYGYNEDFKNEFYQRRWSKPIFTYGTMYNDADVALAPLSNTYFNSMKSQLKIIEAGCYKCPIIASNHPPYTIDVVDGKNGFLIEQNDKKGWYDKIKFFTENPNAVIDMGESLHETVINNYTLDKINAKRIEFFKIICK